MKSMNIINLKKYYIFTRELAILTKNGIRIVDSLNLIMENEENKKFKLCLKNIRNDILKGKNLYESFSRYENIFDKTFLAMIKIGEASSTISERLEDMEKIILNKLENRKKIISMLIYPIIVIIFAFLLIIFIIKFVLPNFIEIFNQNEVELPVSTKILLSIYTNFNLIILLLLLIIIIIYFLNSFIKKKFQLKLKRDQFILKIPIINKIIKITIASRIFKEMAILLDSGINIYDLADILESEVYNLHLKLLLKRVLKKIKLGESIAENLKKMNLVSNNYYELLFIAEETGNISKQLHIVANILENDLIIYKKRILIIIEPLIMLLLGLIVAFILISIYLPILNMNNII